MSNFIIIVPVPLETEAQRLPHEGVGKRTDKAAGMRHHDRGGRKSLRETSPLGQWSGAQES